MVSESATNLDFRDQNFDQAQIDINISTSRKLSDIQLQLIHSFQIKRDSEINILGCVILPNGHVLLANYENENASIEYSETGEHVRDILVTSASYDIDPIDIDRIVVTYGDALFMEIINNNTSHLEKKIAYKRVAWEYLTGTENFT